MDLQYFLTVLGLVSSDDVEDAAPFTPADLSGTVTWFDASDTSTITVSGNDVTAWADKLGSGRTFDGASGAQAPQSGTRTVNSLNVIDCIPNDFLVSQTAGSNYLDVDAYEVYAVVVIDAATTDLAAIEQNSGIWVGSGATNTTTIKTTGSLVGHWNDDGTPDSVTAVFTPGNTELWLTRHESGTIYLSKDGGSEVSTASGNTAWPHVLNMAKGFAATFSDIALCEFVFCKSVQSSGDRTSMINALKTKWGIS